MLGLVRPTAGSFKLFGASTYHNKGLQTFAPGGEKRGSSSFESDGETVEATISCVDVVNGTLPSNIELLTEEERVSFEREMRTVVQHVCIDW